MLFILKSTLIDNDLSIILIICAKLMIFLEKRSIASSLPLLNLIKFSHFVLSILLKILRTGKINSLGLEKFKLILVLKL